MVDRLHILIVTELKKPLAIASIVAGGGMRGRDDGGNTNNVQYKANQNSHYESPLYYEYI
jgi:hypothetical protein